MVLEPWAALVPPLKLPKEDVPEYSADRLPDRQQKSWQPGPLGTDTWPRDVFPWASPSSHGGDQEVPAEEGLGAGQGREAAQTATEQDPGRTLHRGRSNIMISTSIQNSHRSAVSTQAGGKRPARGSPHTRRPSLQPGRREVGRSAPGGPQGLPSCTLARQSPVLGAEHAPAPQRLGIRVLDT